MAKRRLKTVANSLKEHYKLWNNYNVESFEYVKKMDEDLTELVTRLLEKYPNIHFIGEEGTYETTSDVSLETKISQIVESAINDDREEIKLIFAGSLTNRQIGDICRIIPMFVFKEYSVGLTSYYSWTFNFYTYFKVNLFSEMVL